MKTYFKFTLLAVLAVFAVFAIAGHPLITPDMLLVSVLSGPACRCSLARRLRLPR
jgi:hypothetical protein